MLYELANASIYDHYGRPYARNQTWNMKLYFSNIKWFYQKQTTYFGYFMGVLLTVKFYFEGTDTL